jgi:DNA-binding transcriptional ArsR family regulator
MWAAAPNPGTHTLLTNIFVKTELTVMTQPAMHMIREADAASAVLNPLRRRLLASLAAPDSASGLARRLGLPRQLVNYHVRQLERAGLVEPAGERRRRNCTERLVRAVARSYLIDPAALGPLAADPDAMADRTSSAHLVAQAARLIQEVAVLRDGADREERRLPTLTLGTAIRFATPAAQRAFAADLTRAVAELAARYHDEAAPDGRRFRLFAGAWPVPPDSPREAGP